MYFGLAVNKLNAAGHLTHDIPDPHRFGARKCAVYGCDMCRTTTVNVRCGMYKIVQAEGAELHVDKVIRRKSKYAKVDDANDVFISSITNSLNRPHFVL